MTEQKIFKEIQKAKNKIHMKKCSTFLDVKEMQIKITRFHLFRMTIIKNTNKPGASGSRL
jgi:hypothetical protein